MCQNLAQHHLFDLSPKHATTHQPHVTFPNSRFARAADDDTDHTVVSKYVCAPHLQSEDVWIVFRHTHFTIAISARRQVELGGLVDKLHDSAVCRSRT